MTSPATLRMLVEHRVGLFCWCPRCAWREVLDGGVLCAMRGAAYLIPAVSRDIMCRRCGRIGPEVQPDWPGPGRIVTPIP